MSVKHGSMSRAQAGEGVAGSPQELLARSDLSREAKVEILHQWELDLREAMVAEEENMPASAAEAAGVSLTEVLDALRALGVVSRFHDVSTKHG